VKNFHELKVWNKAHQLTLEVYRITTAFPSEELYGLTAQIRRTCASIPADLAEDAAGLGIRTASLLLYSHDLRLKWSTT
jgi:hypothetical protein